MGSSRTAVNLAIVMLLGGLWHGASWNFVIWGALHGTLLGSERVFGKKPLYYMLPRFLRVAVTFILVLIAWVFFRAETLSGAMYYLGSMFGLVDVPDTSLLLAGLVYTPFYLIAVAGASIIVWGAPQTWDWTKNMGSGKVVVTVLLFVFSVAILSMQSYNPFIYFNF